MSGSPEGCVGQVAWEWGRWPPTWRTASALRALEGPGMMPHPSEIKGASSAEAPIADRGRRACRTLQPLGHGDGASSSGSTPGAAATEELAGSRAEAKVRRPEEGNEILCWGSII